MFRRLLVANRGEVALRIITAAQKLGIEAVVVQSEADADAPYLSAADCVVPIGPAPAAMSYLNADAILQAAEQYDCQAIHPGYGFLSESAVFAERCRQQQIAFIGPRANEIRLMGDKATAKRTMREAGVPLIPGSEGILATAAEAVEIADRIGYPVIVKATAGGGGRGMRICRNATELTTNFGEATMEAAAAFGNGDLYLERYVERSRHIEFQVLADAYGHVVHLGERECSVQRKHQKLIEEARSPALTPAQRESIGARIVDAVRSVGYRSAGTVEMLFDPDGTDSEAGGMGQGALYFLEMNTRLQVEHPVTEMITGVDIVQAQIRIAANEPLPFAQADIRFEGHAIECRLNAEDPDADFAPRPGTITALRYPSTWRHFTTEREGIVNGDPTVRLDTHVAEGYTIPPYYDSMIGKLIVHAADRPRAIDGMLAALDQLTLEGPDLRTTIPLHSRVLSSPHFRAGTYDTSLLAEIESQRTRS